MTIQRWKEQKRLEYEQSLALWDAAGLTTDVTLDEYIAIRCFDGHRMIRLYGKPFFWKFREKVRSWLR